MHKTCGQCHWRAWPGPLALALGFRDSQGGEVGQIKLEAEISWSTRRRFPGPELSREADSSGTPQKPVQAQLYPSLLGNLGLGNFKSQFLLAMDPLNSHPSGEALKPKSHCLLLIF